MQRSWEYWGICSGFLWLEGAGLRLSMGRGSECPVSRASNRRTALGLWVGRGAWPGECAQTLAFPARTHVIGRPPGLELQVPLQQRRLQPQEFLSQARRPVEILVRKDRPDGLQVLRGEAER